MSAIALIIRDLGPQMAKSTSLLSSTFSLGLKDVKALVSGGMPIVERTIFDRKNPAFPEQLVTVLEQLDALGCDWVAFELLDGQRYSPNNQYFELTASRLRSMIAARAESVQQQRELGKLEGGST
jgi:hypothetical protein